MIPARDKQVAARERTLLLALILSMWGPLATGMAMTMSRSTTQVADFVRRTVELVALLVSWLVFRHVSCAGPDPGRRAQLQRMAGWSVALALGCSSAVMFTIAWSRLTSAFEPGGRVQLGLAIAALGLVTNGWFWRRYARFSREQSDTVIDAQHRLYRAKTLVDLGVVVALAAVAGFPSRPVTRYVDLVGTFVVATYLLWSSVRSGRALLYAPRQPAGQAPDPAASQPP
ncbi:MAG: cation transporter [Bacillota bacterium]